jgi:hypothetical protein
MERLQTSGSTVGGESALFLLQRLFGVWTTGMHLAPDMCLILNTSFLNSYIERYGPRLFKDVQ